jgi:hypothetical protein
VRPLPVRHSLYCATRYASTLGKNDAESPGKSDQSQRYERNNKRNNNTALHSHHPDLSLRRKSSSSSPARQRPQQPQPQVRWFFHCHSQQPAQTRISVVNGSAPFKPRPPAPAVPSSARKGQPRARPCRGNGAEVSIPQIRSARARYAAVPDRALAAARRESPRRHRCS